MELLEGIVPGVDLKKDEHLVTEGKLNSLAIVEIIVAVSDALNIKFPFEEMRADNFESYETIEEMLNRIMSGSNVN
jgi:acyl carrier protein